MDHTESRSAVSSPDDEPPHVTRAQINVTELHAALTKALCHGARAARIARHAPGLLDILAPGAPLNADTLEAVEATIRAAVDSIGGPDAAALSKLLGLEPGTLGRHLSQRREAAARVLGIEADTFRRTRQRALLWDLAMEIYHAHPE